MEESYDTLIYILEESVKKNGEKPLTNKWLLNLLKMARYSIEEEESSPSIGDGPDW